MIYSLSREEDR